MLCGREKEIEEVLAQCKPGQLLVVSGHPGLGITTLIDEGIAPAMRGKGYIVVAFRDWLGRFVSRSLKEALAQAVREQADSTFAAQTETLDQMLDRIRAGTGRSVALLLDQFEDYFRCHMGTDLSEAFDAELALAIAEGGSCFVIALQEYSMSGLKRFEHYVPDMRRVEVKLGPLDAEASKEAVTRAGEARGFAFEPAVREALVTAPLAYFKGGVHPFFLMAGVEHAIVSASEKKKRAIVDANRLILESLDPKLNKLTLQQKELFIRWLPLLLTDQRLAVSADGLKDRSGNLSKLEPGLMPLLMEFGILRTVEVRGTVRYEISRDSFAPMIRDWWKRQDAKLTARHRALFSIKALSLAIGSVGLIYVVYLITTLTR